jgi:hypothetical protein
MTKVPTSYCLVTRDRETLKKFIKNGGSLPELEKDLVAKNSFLFSSRNNSNFISFSASFIKDEFNVKIKFIDPKNEFFSRFVSRSVSDALEEFDVAPSGSGLPGGVTLSDSAAKKDFQNSIKKIQEEISKTYTAPPPKTSGDTASSPDDLIQTLPTTAISPPVALDRDMSLYVTFGVGQDLKYWTGPIRTVIDRSKIEVDKGKVVSLTLAPAPIGPGQQEKSKGALNVGKEIIIEGSSRNINLKNLSSTSEDLPAYSPFINLNNVSKKTKNIIESRFSDLQEEEDTKKSSSTVKKLKIDYHYLIVDCIRSFLQKAYRTNNVIVLLPDINKYCSKKIEEAFSEASADDPLPTAKNLFGSFSFSKATKAIKRLSPFYRSIKVDTALKSFLTSMGFSYVSANKKDSEYPQGRNSVYPIGIINKLVQTERSKNAEESNQKLFEENNFYCKYTVVAYGEEPNAKIAVKDIVDSINNASNDGTIIYSSLSYENNSNILDVFSNYSNDDNYPLIPKEMNPNEPCLIFGSKNIIANYLYKSRQADTRNFACLHPADEALLSNDRFIRDLATAKNSALNDSGFIDTLYPPPDQLALDIHRNSKTKILLTAAIEASQISNTGSRVGETEEDKVPIFKFNTKNPNVLGFSLRDDNALTAALNISVSKYIENKASILATGKFPEGIATFKQLTAAEEKKREIAKNSLHDLPDVEAQLDEAANKYLQNLFDKDPEKAQKAYNKFRFSRGDGDYKEITETSFEEYKKQDIQGLGAYQGTFGRKYRRYFGMAQIRQKK